MFFEILSIICLLFLIILLSVFIVEKKKAINRFNEAQKEFLEKIENINKENEQLRTKLEIFTEISSDSQQLNEIDDLVNQEQKLEKASSEIDRHYAIYFQKKVVEDNKTAIDIESFEPSKSDSILDSDQMRAYSAMENTNDNFFITGKAGTGKSFLLRLFELKTEKTTLKVAPTGIAALNVNGSTIHSTFGFYNLVDLDVENINMETIRLKSEKKMVLKFVKTIIIDEISMVRADTFDKIDRILRVINNCNDLFGGKQVLVFGDLFQLPPIVNKEEEDYLKNKYGGIFFFFSNAYKQANFNFIELETNHRQREDGKFYEMLNRIRVNLVTEDDILMMNRRVSTNSDNLRRVVRLYPTKGRQKE